MARHRDNSHWQGSQLLLNLAQKPLLGEARQRPRVPHPAAPPMQLSKQPSAVNRCSLSLWRWNFSILQPATFQDVCLQSIVPVFSKGFGVGAHSVSTAKKKVQ